MTRNHSAEYADSTAPNANDISGFVSNGLERLNDAVQTDARRIVEAKYADEWNASGLFRRWKLQRKMDAEIAELTTAMMPDVSPDALF